MTNGTKLDRSGLLLVTFGCICALTWVGIRALSSAKLDPNAATLLGAIVAGLISTSGASIQALRGYAMSAQLGKVTDQLAASGPVADPTVPQSVVIEQPPGEPVPVEEQH